jgi:DICT domain-containing protein
MYEGVLRRRRSLVPVKNFSLFNHALQLQSEAAMDDLGSVANVSRRDFDERVTFRFRSQVPCLEYVSLLIENMLLLRAVRVGRVYAGFERLSHLEPVVDRYLRIADLSERVYIFGETNWLPPRHPNMQIISIKPEMNLAREWFVVVDSPALHCALVAHDETGWMIPMSEERTFTALVTHNAALVDRFAEAIEDYIDDVLAA